MNPHNNEVPASQPLPPVVEQLTAANSAESPQQSPEAMPASPERAGSVQSAPPAAAMPSIQLPAPPIIPTTTPPADDSSVTDAVNSLVKDDGDLIEKEWVNKAKHIVEATRNDPHKQSEELTVVKADYMKKRYGKTIKLSQ